VSTAGSSKDFFFPVLNEEVEKISALIAAGHSLEGRVDAGRHNYTPLGLAALELKQRSVEALVEGGADVNFVGPSGLRPIRHALGSANRKTKEQTATLVRYLIELCAQLTAEDVELMEGIMDSRSTPIFSDEMKQFIRAAFERQQAGAAQ
jgi:hypothetical protein